MGRGDGYTVAEIAEKFAVPTNVVYDMVRIGALVESKQVGSCALI